MTIHICTAYEIGMKAHAVQKFYEDCWPKKTALLIDEFYQWQFTKSPMSQGLDHCCLAIDSSSQKLIGVTGINPKPFYLNGQSIKGAEFTTWIIHPDYRGKGIGSSFIRYLQEQYELIVGMGATDMAIPAYCSAGFRYLRGIPRYIKVFNWEAVSKYCQVTPLAVKIDQYWNKNNPIEKYTLLSENDANIEFLHDQNQDYFNYFSRAAAYVRWRYIEHPIFSYRYYIVSKSESEKDMTLVCFREEKSIPGTKILHVLECVGSASGIPSAVCFIEQYARDYHFDFVDFCCTSTHIGKFFLSRGWFSAMDDDCIKMPHLFHPIEFKTPPTISLFYWTKQGMSELCDLSKLYITKQDVDFDRPTYATALSFSKKNDVKYENA